MRLKTFAILVFCLILQTDNLFGFKSDKVNIKNLQKLFTEAVGQDFEIVRHFLDTRPAARGGETYWLVHVKPKRIGHFALKYTYKYTHKFSHPEEGENELFIRIGAKGCNRYNNNNLGISNFCLGDTVIVPIRVDVRANHQFSLKSTYLDGEGIGKTPNYFIPKYDFAEQVTNPLEKHIKYLGTTRSVMPHRNYGAQTIVYTAYFQAQKAGKFNLALNSYRENETVDLKIKMNPLDALPIIIVNPGTPITALVYQENTINYSDNKRFSGHAGNNFLTKLLIIQPGDIFSIEYSRFTEREKLGKRENLMKSEPRNENSKLVMFQLPFIVNKDWSYNQWLINYLP